MDRQNAFRQTLTVVLVAAAIATGCKDDKPAAASPRDAAAAFARAMRAGDVEAARAVSVGDDASTAAMVAFVEYAHAIHRLRTASEAKYGDPSAVVVSPGISADASILASAEQGRLDLNGDNATLVGPRPREEVKLRRIDGGWKVDRSSFLLGGEMLKSLPTLRLTASAYLETAREIEAGEHPTARQAKQSLDGRILALILQPDHPATRPATRPRG